MSWCGIRFEVENDVATIYFKNKIEPISIPVNQFPQTEKIAISYDFSYDILLIYFNNNMHSGIQDEIAPDVIVDYVSEEDSTILRIENLHPS